MSKRRATPAAQAATATERLLTTAEAAERLGRHPRTLENWRSRRAHLPYVTVPGGRRFVGYRVEDIDAYISSLPVVEVAR